MLGEGAFLRAFPETIAISHLVAKETSDGPLAMQRAEKRKICTHLKSVNALPQENFYDYCHGLLTQKNSHEDSQSPLLI